MEWIGMDSKAVVKEQANFADEEPVVWSIGIFSGPTLLDLKPAREASNPVISPEDVSDARAEFVADPFMIEKDGVWWMFFEVLNSETQKGEIGLATSENGFVWDYQSIVLAEPFHLSYPYVFALDTDYYMIPETLRRGAVSLYKADVFPAKWSLAATIIDGAWSDPSIFFYESRWWLFASPASPKNDTLCLFYAEDIGGPWHAHPMNPIVEGNNQIARPGGRVTVTESGVIRFTQACYPDYGMHVRAFRIIDLTTTAYSEEELERSPILGPGESWSRSGIHHIDPHRVDGGWLACVDGWRVVKEV